MTKKNPRNAKPTAKQVAWITPDLRPLAVAIAEVKVDPKNARAHDDPNINAIKASLREFGQRKPIVVNRRNQCVEAGNGALLAARLLRRTYIAVVWVEDDDSTQTGYAIADNRTAELATWDDDRLAEAIAMLETEAPDLYGDLLLAELMGEQPAEDLVDPEPQIDRAAELQQQWGTETGQLWIIEGKQTHRLLCGDSTKREDVDRVMGGEVAEMMFADPPYGVDYDGGHFHSGDVNIKRARRKMAADSTTDVYAAFLTVIVNVVKGPCYMWFADSRGAAVYAAVEAARCEIHALIIWHKINAAYAAMNAQYKQRHEPCLYFKPKGSTLRWTGPTNECTLWEIKRDAVNDKHPTQKPVELAARAIGNHDAATVLDPSLGSGTTMVAAEQLGRRCFGLEISEAYCAVILERMTDLGCECGLADG